MRSDGFCERPAGDRRGGHTENLRGGGRKGHDAGIGGDALFAFADGHEIHAADGTLTRLIRGDPRMHGTLVKFDRVSVISGRARTSGQHKQAE